ncbi:MAG: hypothetical protein WAN43_00275 [Rhodomicrobium sp.]
MGITSGDVLGYPSVNFVLDPSHSSPANRHLSGELAFRNALVNCRSLKADLLDYFR